jgi:hypothetical protein
MIYSAAPKQLVRRWGFAAFALFCFMFSEVVAAAQEQPQPSGPPSREEPVTQAAVPDETLPESPPSLPNGTELVDIEYHEPEGEPDFDAAALTRPASSEPSLEKIGGALYRYFSAPAETRHREPLRRFDWELVMLNMNVANNLVGATDILQETIKISGAELSSRASGGGFQLNTDVKFRSAVDFNRNAEGFGTFITVDGRVDLNASDTLLSLLANGNAGNTSLNGSFSLSGAVFADVGFHRYFDTNKWRVDVRPAWFLPLLYLPQSEVSFIFDTEDSVTLGVDGAATAYLPINQNKSGIGMLNNAGGLDFSASVEYALFPILDIAVSLTHIPFMPARLTNKVSASIKENILDNVSLVDILTNPDSLSLDFSPDYSASSAEIYVTRPFNLNTWLLYRPFRTDFLTVKPNIGFTTNTPAGATYFNIGLELEMNVARTFFLRARSGLEDGIWKHGAGLGLNLHIIQLNIEAAITSQEYWSAWAARGLSVGIGLHFGV